VPWSAGVGRSPDSALVGGTSSGRGRGGGRGEVAGVALVGDDLERRGCARYLVSPGDGGHARSPASPWSERTLELRRRPAWRGRWRRPGRRGRWRRLVGDDLERRLEWLSLGDGRRAARVAELELGDGGRGEITGVAWSAMTSSGDWRGCARCTDAQRDRCTKGPRISVASPARPGDGGWRWMAGVARPLASPWSAGPPAAARPSSSWRVRARNQFELQTNMAMTRPGELGAVSRTPLASP